MVPIDSRTLRCELCSASRQAEHVCMQGIDLEPQAASDLHTALEGRRTMPLMVVDEMPVVGTAARADWGVATAVWELGVLDVVAICAAAGASGAAVAGMTGS